MKEQPIPKLLTVDRLRVGESITQIMPFGNGALALLTSHSRVLIPGPTHGEWKEIPVPPVSQE